MTYKGHVENGAVVFDEPTPLADGTPVRIEVLAAENTSAPTPAIAGGERSAWPQWLREHGPVPDEDLRLINQAILEAFEQIDPNAWH